MKGLGYRACKQWLDNGLWHDVFPPDAPPPSGEQAARAFLESLLDLDAFARDWDRCLEDRGLKERPVLSAPPPWHTTAIPPPPDENASEWLSVAEGDIPEWVRRYAVAGGVAGSVFSLALIAFLIWGRG